MEQLYVNLRFQFRGELALEIARGFFPLVLQCMESILCSAALQFLNLLKIYLLTLAILRTFYQPIYDYQYDFI